mmetsp:Transcript_19074/g.48794  ORF Transcript_19074/g.48794 Transcript_19074/m.48794 type:complete len:99 (-) Transcript_19074:925-1221(-)
MHVLTYPTLPLPLYCPLYPHSSQYMNLLMLTPVPTLTSHPHSLSSHNDRQDLLTCRPTATPPPDTASRRGLAAGGSTNMGVSRRRSKALFGLTRKSRW